MAEIEQLGRFMIYKLGALWAEYFFGLSGLIGVKGKL